MSDFSSHKNGGVGKIGGCYCLIGYFSEHSLHDRSFDL